MGLRTLVILKPVKGASLSSKSIEKYVRGGLRVAKWPLQESQGALQEQDPGVHVYAGQFQMMDGNFIVIVMYF